MLTILQSISPSHLRVLYLLYPSTIHFRNTASSILPHSLPFLPAVYPILDSLHITTSNATMVPDKSSSPIDNLTLTEGSLFATQSSAAPRLRMLSVEGFRTTSTFNESSPGERKKFHIEREMKRIFPELSILRWQPLLTLDADPFLPFLREWLLRSKLPSTGEERRNSTYMSIC